MQAMKQMSCNQEPLASNHSHHFLQGPVWGRSDAARYVGS